MFVALYNLLNRALGSLETRGICFVRNLVNGKLISVVEKRRVIYRSE